MQLNDRELALVHETLKVHALGMEDERKTKIRSQALQDAYSTTIIEIYEIIEKFEQERKRRGV